MKRIASEYDKEELLTLRTLRSLSQGSSSPEETASMDILFETLGIFYVFFPLRRKRENLPYMFCILVDRTVA